MPSRPFEPDLVNTSVGKRMHVAIIVDVVCRPLSSGKWSFYFLYFYFLSKEVFWPMRDRELHVISNGRKTMREFAEIASHIHPFATGIHLREKARGAKEIWEGVQLLLQYGVPAEKIYINDRVDVAAAAKVKGVQLAYHSLEPHIVKQSFPSLRIGRSVHSPDEGKAMERQGADFLLYGHIFPTGSKPGLQARGIEGLAVLVKEVHIPVIAIGGIDPGNVSAVMGAGAAGIAVMSGILDADEPRLAARQYFEALHKGEYEI